MEPNTLIQLSQGGIVVVLLYLLQWFMKRDEKTAKIIERNTEAFIELKTILSQRDKEN